MKRSIIIFFLLFSLLSCRGQDFIEWVQSGAATPCTEGYSLSYNSYAITDSRLISSSSDWVVPTLGNYQALANTLGASNNYTSNTISGKLKETGFTYWDSPNSGATNESGFNGKGTFERDGTAGTFSVLKRGLKLWTRSPVSTTGFYTAAMVYNNTTFICASQFQYHPHGLSIRLLYTGAGTPTSYTGNDGRAYRIVLIGTQYWLADNLRETKFRNGDIIPYHGADNTSNFTNAEWAALTTAGVCAYNNDVANVGCDFTFPTE